MKFNTVLIILFVLSLLASGGVYYFQKSSSNVETEGCIPANYRKEVVDEKLYLKWETKEECTGYVKYGLKDSTFPYLAVDENNTSKSKEHSVLISGIEGGEEIYVVIYSGDEVYGNDGLPLKVSID